MGAATDNPVLIEPLIVDLVGGIVALASASSEISATKTTNATKGTIGEVPSKGKLLSALATENSKSENDAKPSSAGKMQQEIRKGQAPKDVKRVDQAHNADEGGKPHLHYKDGTSSNNDGSIHDAGKGTPSPSRKVMDWLKSHNWIPPSKP